MQNDVKLEPEKRRKLVIDIIIIIIINHANT